MVHLTRLTIFGLVLVFASLTCPSTAHAQFFRGPFGGGIQVRSPFFAVPFPRPMPPMIPPPVAVLPGPSPVFAVSPFRYGVRRVPVYEYRPRPIYSVAPAWDNAYSYPGPSVRLSYSSPAGAGSIVVNSAPDLSSRETFGQIPVPTQDTAAELRQAAARLHNSLAYRRDGETWITYLAPHRIVAAIDQQNPTALADLINHYDGVTANQQLTWLTQLDGFSDTRYWLAAYLNLNAPQSQPSLESGILGPNANTGSSLLSPAEPDQSPQPAVRPSAPPTTPDPADEAPLPAPAAEPTPAEPIKPAGGPTST